MSALTDDERSLLGAGVRAALGAEDTLQAAREVLEGGQRSDDWPIATAAGWPGLLAGEEDGGAGLGAPEALLVMHELGRALAGVPLFGHLMATALVAAASRCDGTEAPIPATAGASVPASSGAAPAARDATAPRPGDSSASWAAGLATGERRAVWLPVRPEADRTLSADPVAGRRRLPGPRLDEAGRVTGTVGWVPDAPGADLIVTSLGDADGRRWTALIAAADAETEEIAAYDPSRRLGHVRLEQVSATLLPTPIGVPEDGWALAQALLGGEALGAAERLLEMSVAHARSRFAFGRAIGSFQAIKHQLVEVLRRLDTARALADRAGAALAAGDSDAYTTACALRFSAGDALDVASRTAIAVHGGMGATWEHPASLYFRRAQVARRLLGGHGAAATEVGRRLLTAA